MMEPPTIEQTVRGYRLCLDRAYDAETHMWVQVVDPARVRVGLDPLGVETSGTLAQLSFGAPGDDVQRGAAFGSLEAEKFVGPLVSPLSGTIFAVNDAVLADPGLVERDPFGQGWLVELAPSALDVESAALVHGARVADWFKAKVDEYRLKGVLAE